MKSDRMLRCDAMRCNDQIYRAYMFKTVTISIRLLKSGSPLFKFVVKKGSVEVRVRE